MFYKWLLQIKKLFGNKTGEVAYKIPAGYSGLIYKPTLTTQDVFNLIKHHMDEAKALSLIRLGDGEGAMIGYPGFISKRHFNMFLKLFFGKNKLTKEQKKLLVQEVKDSVLNADIIGVFRGDEINTYTFVRVMLQHYNLVAKHARLCGAQIHIDLQEKNLLHALLNNLDVVGIITCRDVADKMQKAFSIKRVVVYKIPEEARHAQKKYDVPRHFPDRFEELREIINVEYPGMLFLVGAGVCGKVYCRWIKGRGGIAIDIGSIFDGWAGKPTRKYLRDDKITDEEVVCEKYLI